MEEAILYVRVSTKEQGDKFSLDAQGKLGVEYAQRNKLNIVKTWSVAESAWGKAERQGFNQLIDYAKKHKNVKHIIFDVLDRMTRNDFDKIKIITLIKEHGKTIHFSRSNKIYSASSSPDDEFMMDIEVAVAKKMSNDISRKTKMGLLEKAEQGIYPSNCPLGYLNNKITGGIDIDPVQAPLVQYLFQKVASGMYSIAMLVEDLTAKGMRHKTRQTKIRENTLYKMLANPFYYGVFRWSGKLYQGTHTPLISKELRDKALEALGSSHRPTTAKRNYAFRGLLVCKTCDCTVIGEKAKGKYIYYRCSFSKGQHKHDGYLREEALIEKFAPIVSAITLPEQATEWLKEGITQMAGKQSMVEGNRKDILQADLTKTENKLKKLCDLRLEDKINDGYFQEKQKELAAEVAKLKNDIALLSQDTTKIIKKAEETFEVIKSIDYWYKKADKFEKAQILKLLATGYILDGKNIKTTYRMPFNFIAEANKNLSANSAQMTSIKDFMKGKTTGFTDDTTKSSNFLQKGG